MKTRINEWWNVFWKNIFCKVWIESRKLFFADKKITRDNFQHGCKEKKLVKHCLHTCFHQLFLPKSCYVGKLVKSCLHAFSRIFFSRKILWQQILTKRIRTKKWFKKFQEFWPKTWGHLFLVPFQPVVLPTLLSKTGFV